MQLFVKTLTGATLTVNIEGSNIIDELKYVILPKPIMLFALIIIELY
jgi:hypothetical protein